MKVSKQIAAGVAALGLAFTAAQGFAHPGGQGMGHGPMQGHAMMGGCAMSADAATANTAGICPATGPGAMRGHRMGAHAGGTKRGEPLMTTEEHQAFRAKMRDATTPEERQRVAQANRAEMKKRAKERGITQPEQRGPMMGHHMGAMGGGMRHGQMTH